MRPLRQRAGRQFHHESHIQGSRSIGRKRKPFEYGPRWNIGAHDFRRFFSTRLDDAGVSTKARSALGGWMNKELKAVLGLGGSLYSYADKNVNLLRREYEKAVPFLSITRKPMKLMETEEEVKKLKKTVQDLEKRLVEKVAVEGFVQYGDARKGGLYHYTDRSTVVWRKDDDHFKLMRHILLDQGFEEYEDPTDPNRVIFQKPEKPRE